MTSQQNIQNPEWEHVNAGQEANTDPEKPHRRSIRLSGLTGGYTNTRSGFRRRFDTALPPSKQYFGLKRKWFLTAILVVLLALLALIIGLAVGLTQRNKTQNLPLPSNRQANTGDLTYYEPGLGACGITSKSSDSIVAVSHLLFDAESKGSNPNQNDLCNKRIRATRFDEAVNAQRSVDLTVVDRCVGCKATDIDVTESAFAKLANIDDGRVTVTWAWLD